MTAVHSINLRDTRVKWFTLENPELGVVVWGRGYAFITDSYFENEGLLAMAITQCGDRSAGEQIDAFEKLVPALKGCWALVMRANNGTVIAAVDRSRSIPLFYGFTSIGYDIAASAEDIAKKHRDLKINLTSATEYLLSGYISGKETLYKGIYQVQPGEILEIAKSDNGYECHTSNYFTYFPNNYSDASHDELEIELEHIIEKTFARYAKALKGEKVILPLSGGYDSRLIAWMLKKHGVNDVLCYTYGVNGHPEKTIAEQVANALGLKWKFIEYNAKVWSDSINSDDMDGYLGYAFRGTSSPHIQDFPAVKQIMQDYQGDKPVFLPGHVGDAWGRPFALRKLNKKTMHPPSEYHSNYFKIFESPVVSAIIYGHLNLWPVSRKLWKTEPFVSIAKKMYDNTLRYENERGVGDWTYTEWVLRSRTALWIVNSCRCFEYFGGSFMLTLGGNELIDFFNKLPIIYLLYKQLYVSTLNNRIFNKTECPLREMPVRSGSDGPKGNKTKHAIINLLLKSRVYKPLDRLRKPFRTPQNYCESWFTNGHRPESVSIKQALSMYGVEDNLPEEILQIIKPMLRHPSYSIQCNGLLTAILLAREYSRVC